MQDTKKKQTKNKQALTTVFQECGGRAVVLYNLPQKQRALYNTHINGSAHQKSNAQTD